MSEGSEGSSSRRKQNLKATGQKKPPPIINRISNMPVKNVAIAPKPLSAPPIQMANTIEGIKLSGQLQTLPGQSVVFKSLNQTTTVQGSGNCMTSDGRQVMQIQVPGGGTQYIVSSSALVKGLKLKNPTQSVTFNLQDPNIAIKKEPSNEISESNLTFNPQISNRMGNLNSESIILHPIPKSTNVPEKNKGSKTVTFKVVQQAKPGTQPLVTKTSSPLAPPSATVVTKAPVSKDVTSSVPQSPIRSIILPKIPTSQIIKPKVPLILMRRQTIEPEVDSNTEKSIPECPSKKPRILAPKPYVSVARKCRLCGVPDLSTIDIFSTHGVKLGLAEKIALHLPIDVKKSDRLPLKVCEKCINLLNVCHEMSVNCAEVNTKLAQQLEDEIRMKAGEANKPSVPQPIPILLIENPDINIAPNPAPEGEKSSGHSSTQQLVQSKLRVVTDKLIYVDKNLPPPEQIAQVIEAVKAGLGQQNVSLDSLFKTVVQQGAQLKEEINTNTTETSENKGKIFQCQMCQENLPNWFTLIEHQLLKFKCRTCHSRFCSMKQRTIHHSKVHQKTRIQCYRCNARFATQLELQKHRLKQHALKCDCCKKKFATKAGLSLHIQNKLTKECFSCKDCGKVFHTMKTFTEHIKYNRCIFRDKGETFKCLECKRYFYSQERLDEHNKIHIPGYPKLNCQYCNKSFITQTQLNRHEIFHKSKRLKCKLCPKSFSIIAELKYHMEVHANVRKYQCDFCGQKLLHRVHLIKHIRCSHLTKIDYLCLVCQQMYDSKEIVEKHIEEEHTMKERMKIGNPKAYIKITEYQCPICNKYMGSEPSLALHMKRHNDKKKGLTFMCEVCGKNVGTKSGLYQHLKSHSDDPEEIKLYNKVAYRYKCDQCDGRYTTAAQLKAHYSKHTGVKPFKCSYCQKQFTTNQMKTNHELRHKGIRPHVCEICKKGFYDKYSLVVHQRIHTKDKPYQCSYCPKNFPRRSNLTAHERTHTGFKPYTCVVCTHAFTQKISLHKHMCIHTQEKLYKCIYCTFTCDRRKDLTEHEKKVHNLISNTYATKIYMDEDNPPGVTSIVRDTGEMAYQIQIIEEEEVHDL